ncbi:MAG: hypothetical protein HJJLKODD_02997 [Phycisphaerae bacterium]|nr:hypothetical protein [Phycisphaerae bacterium]
MTGSVCPYCANVWWFWSPPYTRLMPGSNGCEQPLPGNPFQQPHNGNGHLSPAPSAPGTDVNRNSHHLIPTSDPTFVFTPVMQDAVEGVERGERVLMIGHSGTGKSSLCREIAAKLQRPIRRINLNGETSVSDLIGHWMVDQHRQTVFVRGVLPVSMERGYILQADEIDAMSPEVAFVLQPVLEPEGRLFLMDTNETVIPHADFRIIGTANTLGFDETGLYAGTRAFNYSWLDRWDVVVELDYLPAEEEAGLLHQRHPTLDSTVICQMVAAANELRAAYKNHRISTVLSTRRLLSLSSRLEAGNTWDRALRLCVLNKIPRDDAQFTETVFARNMGLPRERASSEGNNTKPRKRRGS